jgi:hypothetical protein
MVTPRRWRAAGFAKEVLGKRNRPTKNLMSVIVRRSIWNSCATLFLRSSDAEPASKRGVFPGWIWLLLFWSSLQRALGSDTASASESPVSAAAVTTVIERTDQSALALPPRVRHRTFAAKSLKVVIVQTPGRSVSA